MSSILWQATHMVFAPGITSALGPQPQAAIHAAFVASAAAIDGLETSISQANSSMDWMWLLLGGALVFFMHSGFALLVRSAPDVACRSAFICYRWRKPSPP